MATTVKYYFGITLIGEGTVAPDYSFNWTTAPAGNHAITAKRFVDGVEQESSTAINVVVSAIVTLTAPTNFTATTTGDTTADLTWDGVTNANNYIVERSVNIDYTGATQIYSGTTNSFQDTGLTASTNYYYRVKAQDTVGTYGDSAWRDLSIQTIATPVITVEGISPQTLWHKFNAATVNANPFTASTDSLTATPYNATSQYGISIVTEDAKEWASMGNREIFVPSLENTFKNSFSLFFEIKPNLSRPASNFSVLFDRDGSLGNRMEVFYLGSTGTLSINFKASGVNVGAALRTTSAIIPIGEVTRGYKVAVIFDAINELWKCNVDGVDVAVIDPAISAATMANYANTLNTKLMDSNFTGKVRNVLIQPVAWTQAEIDYLNTL